MCFTINFTPFSQFKAGFRPPFTSFFRNNVKIYILIIYKSDANQNYHDSYSRAKGRTNRQSNRTFSKAAAIVDC